MIWSAKKTIMDNEDEEVVNFCCCVIEGIIVLSVGKEDEDE